MNPSRTLNKLVNDVEELLAELSDEHDPQIDELRNRVAETIGSAKRAIASQRAGVVARIGRYAGSVDDYITGYPRLGFLTGILIGGMMVYVGGLTNSILSPQAGNDHRSR
jgi:ElaB/YqjD/DUF883 family membrane-anchored ribosome-binding protein